MTSKLDQLTITNKGSYKVYTLLYAPIIVALFLYVGAEAISILSNRVSQINIRAQFMVDDDAWPPEQLKCFTPLLVVHYKGHRTSEQVTAMAKLMHTGAISLAASENQSGIPRHSKLDCHETLQVVPDDSKMTKKLEEILAPFENSKEPCFILIEGAPGIGKSVLLKEIAYQWGKKCLLQMFEVVLLICLRDPILQQAKSIPDLLQNFCKGDPDAMEITAASSKYLFDNGGKNLAFLFDGFDELPEKLQTSSLISDILKRRVLPYCGLVLSSRPHATKQFHAEATLRVEILGFTEEEQQHHIHQALQDQPHKIKELTQYFQDHLTVNSLCSVPFNLVVLLYIYKQGIRLPKNSTELYDYFICHTIWRHLTKCGHTITITNLTDLPEPYSKVIQQLSKLSLEALNDNKLIFTLDEIKAACPDITAIPEAINGFGLLQAVKHFGRIGTTMTFNFMYFSIQEYLAAYCIANLPADEELKIIEENFWSNIHSNMFSMYVALTKGQRPSFKHFLYGRNKRITIFDESLDQWKYLHLYRCFHEAGDIESCKTIEQSEAFNRKKIDLSITTFSSRNLQCVTLFLASSFHKEWVKLNLFGCYVQDHNLRVLHHGLLHCRDITITEMRLRNNALTMRSSSLISDIVVKCKVKILYISENKSVGEDKQLYSMLTNSCTMLESLDMFGTKLSSRGAIHLFTALQSNNKLTFLNLNINEITNDACDAITTALEKNSCLESLCLHKNPLKGEGILKIVNSLKVNNTLRSLGLPKCPEDVKKGITFIEEAINRERESQGCQVKLWIRYSI